MTKDREERFDVQAREYFMSHIWLALWHGEDLDKSAASIVNIGMNFEILFA